MGTWDTKPWDNDEVADWFGGLMDKTGLAHEIEAALNGDIEEGYDGDAQVIRAAAAVLLLLGHTYVWPVADLERHLALAISRVEEIIAKGLDEYARESIHAELSVLRARLAILQSRTGGFQPAAPDGRWWCF